MQLTYRPVTADEFAAFNLTTERAFGSDSRAEDVAREQLVFELDRSLGVFDGTDIVATASIYSLELAVPGGTRPVAGVTFVGVLPTHRRRGVGTELMRRQLHGLHEAGGEPVAALWASEGGIYWRFGYGIASDYVSLRIERADTALRPDTPDEPMALRVSEPEEQRAALTTVYDAVWRDRPGWFARNDAWWSYRLSDPEHHREGWSARLALVASSGDGVEGYALYRPKSSFEGAIAANQARVDEVAATTPRAHAALWRCLLDLDLTTRVSASVAADDPLLHLLVDRRRARPVLHDNLWVRLVDVDRALAARAYAAPVDVVLEVTDAFCPWNAGRWRLAGDGSGATCEPTTAAPDLTVDVEALGAAYLGRPTLHELTGTGRVREQTQGALRATARAFGWDRAPHCPMVF